MSAPPILPAPRRDLLASRWWLCAFFVVMSGAHETSDLGIAVDAIGYLTP
jgi:hypothetical protein